MAKNQMAALRLSAVLDRLADECVADILGMTDEDVMAEAKEELGSEAAAKAEARRLRSKIMQAIEDSSRITNELRQQRAVTWEMLNTPMGLIYEETKLPSNAELTGRRTRAR
jgi:hypothetical protein